MWITVMGVQHNPERINGWGYDEDGFFVHFKDETKRWKMSFSAAKKVSSGIDNQYYGKPTEEELKQFEQQQKFEKERADEIEKEISEGKRERPVFRGRSWFGQQMIKAAQEEKD